MAFDYSLHAAEALAALSTGNVAAARGVFSSVGVLLSAAEHGLNPLVPEKEQGTGRVKDGGGGNKKKKAELGCSVGGCSNTVDGRGLCTTHCKRICRRGSNCKKHSKINVDLTNDVHSSEQGCSVGGCSNTVNGRGLCTMHCKRICRRGSNCKKHGKIRTSTLDAAYGVGSSVGVLLSAAAHGLNTLVPQKIHERRGRPLGSKNKSTLAAEAGSDRTVLEYGFGVKDGGAERKEEGAEGCLVGGCANKVHGRGLEEGRGLCTVHCKRICKRGANCMKHSMKVISTDPTCRTPAVLGRDVCTEPGAYGICAALGCTTNARWGKRRLCTKHSTDKTTCTVEGCSSFPQARGLCEKHGALGMCKVDGCATSPQQGGLCSKHGAHLKHSKEKAICSTLECNNGVVVRGLCVRHGAYGWCNVDGCNAGANKGGLCTKHSIRPICLFYDCTVVSLTRGLCVRHGGGRTKMCEIEGCKTLAHARGRCVRHGAYGWCKVDGCTTPAARGFEHCIKHGGGKKKKPCSLAGCTSISHKRGLCSKHGRGTRKICLFYNCTTPARTRGLCGRHGGASTKVCETEGCRTLAQARGLCRRHGAYG